MAVVEEMKKSFQVGAMQIEIYANRASMGFAAASAAAEAMKQLGRTSDLVTGIFATGHPEGHVYPVGQDRSLHSVVRHTDGHLFKTARARVTFSRMSVALAVQMKGLGF